MPVSVATLRTHIDYTAWASRHLVDAATQLSIEDLNRDFQTADRSVLHTLVHIYAADRVWLARIEGRTNQFITDADRSLAVLQIEWPALLDRWKLWADGLTDSQVTATITYTDLKGREWTTPIWQVVLHVVNHATHHRGQAVGFMRSMGHLPPSVDLIYYYRELGKAATA